MGGTVRYPDPPETHPIGIALMLSLGLWGILFGIYWLIVR